MAILLSAENLAKVFRSGESDLAVFEDLHLEVEVGEMVAIVGESGSGKSTLLHLLGLLDKPSRGAIYFQGKPHSQLTETEQDELRNRDFGFVWQMHYLLPEFTAQENVMLPLMIRGDSRLESAHRAQSWLERVGLSQRGTHRAGELSGGEQQRVALARALVSEPKLLLADEPTGNLDARTGEETMQLIRRLHRESQLTTILVTHNAAFARRCDRVLQLTNGRLEPISVSQPM